MHEKAEVVAAVGPAAGDPDLVAATGAPDLVAGPAIAPVTVLAVAVLAVAAQVVAVM